MTTAQQLREALGRMTQGEYAIRDNHALLVLNETFPGGCEQVADGLKRKDVESIAYIINILPFFLDEYEKLEREAAAGRVLAEAVEKMNDMIVECLCHPKPVCSCSQQTMNHWENNRMRAISAYHTACGKGEGV